MKHALIMTAYKDVEQINRFIKYTPEDWGIYIHVDKKSSISLDDIDKRAHLYKRYKIYWGATEHLYAFLLLLSEAIRSGEGYDYFHLVSGQDFYACSPIDFDSLLGCLGYNYIGLFNLPADFWLDWDKGYAIFKYRTISSWCDIRKMPARLFNKAFRLFQIITNTCRSIPTGDLFGSSVYCSLHKDYVSWMLNDPSCQSLAKNLRHSICAEEVYFATTIMNSPYKDKVCRESLHLAIWDTEGEPPPKHLTIKDWNTIINSHCLFCRKISSTTSKNLIPLIEKFIIKV